jgi:hypothetical protein
MQVRRFTELALKISAPFINKISSGLHGSDDTVEGQSKAFRIWMFSSTAAILMMLVLSFSATRSSEARSQGNTQPGQSLIEQVPEGFVLVPIEPQNFETIDALIENHAYVDLYNSSIDESYSSETIAIDRRKRLIARGLPLVRAPKNPSRFAVLVKEADTEILTRLGVPVLVVVRKGPPKGGYPEKRKSKAKLRNKILKSDFIVEEIPDSESQNSN